MDLQLSFPHDPDQGFANALKWVKEMKDMEEEMNDKLTFLGCFVTSFRDHIHTDIQVKPGNNGPPIPAHRALLVISLSLFNDSLSLSGNNGPPKCNFLNSYLQPAKTQKI